MPRIRGTTFIISRVATRRDSRAARAAGLISRNALRALHESPHRHRSKLPPRERHYLPSVRFHPLSLILSLSYPLPSLSLFSLFLFYYLFHSFPSLSILLSFPSFPPFPLFLSILFSLSPFLLTLSILLFLSPLYFFFLFYSPLSLSSFLSLSFSLSLSPVSAKYVHVTVAADVSARRRERATREERSWRSTTSAHSEHARRRDVPELAPDILNNITAAPGQTAAAAAAETWPRVVTHVEVALVRQESVALRDVGGRSWRKVGRDRGDARRGHSSDECKPVRVACPCPRPWQFRRPAANCSC